MGAYFDNGFMRPADDPQKVNLELKEIQWEIRSLQNWLSCLEDYFDLFNLAEPSLFRASRKWWNNNERRLQVRGRLLLEGVDSREEPKDPYEKDNLEITRGHNQQTNLWVEHKELWLKGKAVKAPNARKNGSKCYNYNSYGPMRKKSTNAIIATVEASADTENYEPYPPDEDDYEMYDNDDDD
ncbi:hypothetical protein NE237_021520 [Protea cynaroides]|uniref:Uncharacterized protein n=1 Tax=Protea cynaroides TaxID=273540 RepID=A0A9Q0K4F5_9MAGN|nr:hypothetical protein NE237_021520 [Protea cynaroides]